MTILAEAERLLAAGRADEAIARVEAAAAKGDVDALMRLATWRMIGAPLARDLTAARTLLRRAVEIGHVDGALMEVALTANGSGGPVDWPGALRLLEVAARGDHVAAEQLALVRAMKIDAAGRPRQAPVGRLVAESPRVLRFERFVTREECAHIARAAVELMEPATVVDPVTGKLIAHPIRTSDNAVIGPAREGLVIRAINHRIAAASGTDIAAGEALTVLRYAPGQQYRPHMDALPGVANQRVKTFLIYLNDGYAGGETHFLAGDITITPRAGDAILFDNVDAAGAPDPTTRHAGLPVRTGVKWLATRWIRAGPFSAWEM